jgi:hypothetical protein
MLIAGLAGADFSCADTMGADRAQATIVEISIEVFIAVFPLGLNGFMFLLPAIAGSQGLPCAQGNGSANKLTVNRRNNAPV